MSAIRFRDGARLFSFLTCALVALPTIAAGLFDSDADCDVDLVDFANFQICFTGPGGSASGGCLIHDSDEDGDVDLTDFNNLQLAFTGPTPPAIGVAAQLAGRSLPHYPFFSYERAINDNDSVEAAIDPNRYPELIGQTCDIYVVDSGSAASGLVDQTPGGPMTVRIVAGGIEDNTFTVAEADELDADAGLDIGRPYDVVFDCNQNGLLDCADLIDGVVESGDEAGFYLFEDTGAFGPLFFAMFEFDDLSLFPVEGPFDGGGSTIMRSRGRAVHPNPLPAGKSPLVSISHGGTGITTTWQGYTYIQQLMASYGYVSASYDMFPAHISIGIRWRATLLNYSTDRMIRQQPAYPIMGGGILNGRVDGSRILTFGHSRGAEGAEVALNQIRDPSIPDILPPNIDPPVTWAGFAYDSFMGTMNIAPVTFLSTVNWQTRAGSTCNKPTRLLYFGGADADVCGCSTSVAPYIHHEGHQTEKMAVSLYGVGHGYYNSVWACVCSGPGIWQRPWVEASARSYFLPWAEYSMKDNLAARDYLTRSPEEFRTQATEIIPADVGGELARQVTQWSPSLEAGCGDRQFIIDNFEQGTGFMQNDVSSSGGDVAFSVTNLLETILSDSSPAGGWSAGEPAGGFTGNAPGIVFDWEGAGPLDYTQEIVASERDFSQWKHLSLRAGQQSGHPFSELANYGDKFFTVELEDGDGGTSRIRTDNYGPIDAPYRRSGGWHTYWRTVQIRLEDFRTNGADVDLTNIRYVRLLFGTDGELSSPNGRMGIDDFMVIR